MEKYGRLSPLEPKRFVFVVHQQDGSVTECACLADTRGLAVQMAWAMNPDAQDITLTRIDTKELF